MRLLAIFVLALLAWLGSAGEDTTSLEGSGHIVGFGEVEASYEWLGFLSLLIPISNSIAGGMEGRDHSPVLVTKGFPSKRLPER